MNPDQRSLTADQVLAICRHAFGSSFQLGSIEELQGGTFNTTYLITSADSHKVVLRISPPATTELLWDEVQLMRREHAMQPFFAPIATLMPQTLFIDFTHQLLDRDYIFQSFLEGERWDEVAEELTPAENGILWNQFGEILQRIHDVQGEQFGLPLPGYQFSSWSQAILDRLERIDQAAREKALEVPNLALILELIRSHPQRLDEIRVPHLLHGDLWSFNILIRRQAEVPAIAGILDADRAWWGDPMADWTMFILKHAEPEEGFEHFWRAYSPPEDTPGLRFRTTVYDAMHAATAYLWASQHRDDGTIRKAQGTLGHVASVLPSLL